MNKQSKVIIVLVLILVGIIGWIGYGYLSDYLIKKGVNIAIAEIYNTVATQGYINLGENMTLVRYSG